MIVRSLKLLVESKLSRRQYLLLAKFKNEKVPDFFYRITLLPFLLILIPILRMCPKKVLISLRSRFNVIRKMDYQNQDILLSIDSEFEYRVRLHSAKKEPETIDWIRTYFEKGDVFYDIGANVGAYTLVASKTYAGNIKVYSFEPAFQNYMQLCKNLVINNCLDEVIPLQVALSDQTMIGEFNMRSLLSGTAVHHLGRHINLADEQFVPVSVLPVLAYKLDDLVEQFRFAYPNHIKIDVDGTEYDVLRGMEKTLSNRTVRTLMLEVNEGTGQSDAITKFLSSKGFQEIGKFSQNHLLVRS